MSVICYDKKGKELKKRKISKEILGEANANLLKQVYVCEYSNKRQGAAHSKDRGEKRGGGRKPWRQKGTGRARHGSRRSPIWRGGGVTFGPRNERNYKKAITEKVKKKAVEMAWAEKMKAGKLVLLDDISLKSSKTKEVAEILKNLPIFGSVLIVTPSYQKNWVLSARNIPKVKVCPFSEITTFNILSHNFVVMDEETFSKKLKNLSK